MIKKDYKVWYFDCDGVLLDSNRIKTEAFYQVALPYGKEEAEKLVAFNKEYGGISRFEKFRHLFHNILNRKDHPHLVDQAVLDFGKIVQEKLLECSETLKMREFLESLPKDSKKHVISGGKQVELREVFQTRGLAKYFDGIFGSPDSKEVIMKNLSAANPINHPAIFVGDSQYDHKTAIQFEVDFVFLSQYTEFSHWQRYFKDYHNVVIVNNFSELM
jgi:phosphoglycolate phosphatase-like HAD superfamily hydrolase